MIHVNALSKSYPDLILGPRVALANVTFDVLPGQIYGILGPNGAGKSTLLRILSTLLRPTSGTAVLNGYDVLHHPTAVRRQIGFVSSNLSVYDRMTAQELVSYYGRLHDLPERHLQARVRDVFAQLGMNDIRDMLCARMSTGMRQKVSIARALVHDPPILIFDEPTVGLDILVARALLEIVLQQRDQGKCILFSTHIMREVERICDRAAILHRGHILAEGTLEELRTDRGTDDLEDIFFSLISTNATDVSGTGAPVVDAITTVASTGVHR